MTVHGWIVLDKPLGLGSTQGVAAVKRALRARGYGKAKVGHGGTLDPLATGVLPIAIGEATKLAGRMLDATKAYNFTIAFGAQTDTLDLEGAVIVTSDHRPSWQDIEAVLPQFTGAITQVPPAYSALKVDGQRAYDRARAGQTVELAPRAVTIHRLFPHHWDTPNDGTAPVDTLTLAAVVSKGTYIRSLARDIALALGTVGHVTMLRRTRAGPFDLTRAISLDKLQAIASGEPLAFSDAILPLEAGLDDIPALDLDPEQARAVRQGRVLTGLPLPDGLWFARSGMIPVALVDLSAGALRVVRGFNLSDVAE
ncbi:tRNA pseudouridine(55) synthase TruB [Novosphingobium sp.]|uniref:tRNA pseudouridine(55) synthase TruB n=1 Tax=Novosphingobium sp. TaxID=1874826 RepID=UPI00333EE325